MNRIRVLLVLLGLVALLAALPIHAQDSTDTDGTPTINPATLTAVKLPVTPTLACPGAPRTRLIVRERARVTVDDPSPLNLREGAGTNFDVITTLDPGDIVFVLEGPECSQRYAWYLVEFEGDEGWIAEGTGTLYFVEVYPPE